MTSTQTKLTFAKRILGALATLVLVACGGGGGGAGSGGGFLPDNNGTPTPSYTLTVAGNGTALLVDNAGNLEATFTVSSDGTVGAGTLTASIDVSGTVFDSQRNVQAAATVTQTFTCIP